MRVTIIPDVHGRNYWKQINPKDCDEIIFLGDYVDSFDISNDDMLNNLLDIIQFKKDNESKVTLLLGNHDLHYLYLGDIEGRFICSGFRDTMAYDLHDIFWENQKLFLNAYQIGNTIFTHAGIQDNWFKEHFKGDSTQLECSIAEQLNMPLNRSQIDALYQVGNLRGGIRGDIGGIFWCDKDELKKPLQGFMQVVGHTHVSEPMKYTYKNAEVWFTDCHRNNITFLTLEL